MNNRIVIAAILSILLAVAVPLITVVKAQSALKNSPVIKVKIAAYDPRDLLYGHYMTYRYEWNWKGGKPDETACYGEKCCLCATDSLVDPEVELSQCPTKDNPKTCGRVIKGSYTGGTDFIAGSNRYYVDETIALPLEDLFRNGKETFRIGLAVTPGGRAMVEKLYVGDQSLSGYFAAHGGTVPQIPEESIDETPTP